MSERQRFDFVRQRDGLEAAVRFMRENVRDTYRKATLGIKRTGRYAMYRRRLIRSYCEAKAILAEVGQ